MVVFYIPNKAEDIEGRDYAQTTRTEIGEWLAYSNKYINKKIFICMDEEVPGYRYIKYKATKLCQPSTVQWCETYESLISMTSKYLNETFSCQNIFFTSDTHFSSERTLELSRRPFKSVDQMNDTLIDNWNSVVKPSDIIYHLGDFGDFGMREHLNGNIHLILGNYEEKDIKEGKYTKNDLLKYFVSVEDIGNISIDPYGSVLMVHEPIKCKDGMYNLFGHIHGRQMIKKFGLDVGVDVHNFTPMSLDDIKFFLNALEKGYYDENVWKN